MNPEGGDWRGDPKTPPQQINFLEEAAAAPRPSAIERARRASAKTSITGTWKHQRGLVARRSRRAASKSSFFGEQANNERTKRRGEERRRLRHITDRRAGGRAGDIKPTPVRSVTNPVILIGILFAAFPCGAQMNVTASKRFRLRSTF